MLGWRELRNYPAVSIHGKNQAETKLGGIQENLYILPVEPLSEYHLNR